MKTGWRLETPQIVLIALMFAAAAVAWPMAPDRIPVHWNAAGAIDRYGGRFEGLLLLPLMALGLYLLMRFLPNLDPGRANYARFGGVYAPIPRSSRPRALSRPTRTSYRPATVSMCARWCSSWPASDSRIHSTHMSPRSGWSSRVARSAGVRLRYSGRLNRRIA